MTAKNGIRLSSLTLGLVLILFSAMSESNSEQEEDSNERDSDRVFIPFKPFPKPKLTPQQKYVRSIRNAASLCQQNDGELAACWSKASPEKCKPLVYAALIEKGDKMRAWYLCTTTCFDAGYWSRTFGECKTELEPVQDAEND